MGLVVVTPALILNLPAIAQSLSHEQGCLDAIFLARQAARANKVSSTVRHRGLTHCPGT
jgi:membrane-bound metal-dependent hydrolase YbcI (DUF457 family)